VILFTIRGLSPYERKWKKILGREIRTGYAARKFFEKLNDRQIDRVFDIVKSGGIDKTLMEAEDLSFDWHGGVIRKVIGFRSLQRILGNFRVPFSRNDVK
jgi:flavin-dependent dehydrogenase